MPIATTTPPLLLTPEAMGLALANRPAVAQALGTPLGAPPDHWQITEVSDGNMNAVFRVAHGNRSVIAKYAPPFIRVIGESWPFPHQRIAYEHASLRHHRRLCPKAVPEIVDFDAHQALLVTEDFRDLTIARRAFIEGRTLPRFAEQLGHFLAHSLFFTSDLALPTTEKMALVAEFAGNAELCATTEAVIFNGPYWQAPLNRHTPSLEPLVRQVRNDTAWHAAAADLNLIFRSKTQALIHGDLHTGSIMVDEQNTKVIDPEWAFHGPMGFDLGAVIGNLLIAYASQPGHGKQREGNAQARADYAAWLLSTIEALWHSFTEEFRTLAHQQRDMSDDALLTPKLFDEQAVDAYLDRYLADLLADTAGFAGAKMTRRVIGISHVEDLEEITDEADRVACETQVLAIARALVVDRHAIKTISSLTDLARQLPAITA